MLLYDLSLGISQSSALKQDAVRNGHFPNIMQDRAAPNMNQFGFAKIHSARKLNCGSGNSLSMSFRLSITQFKSTRPAVNGGIICLHQFDVRTLQLAK